VHAASRCRGHCQGAARCQWLSHFNDRYTPIGSLWRTDMTANLDSQVVEGFGDEWSRFDQSNLDEVELGRMFASYFAVFPWERLPLNAEVRPGLWKRPMGTPCRSTRGPAPLH
jgi:hypothetical protein